jgi:two-component system OmpR family response regulator
MVLEATNPPTILIVEHDEGTITLYARMLRIEGYIVRIAVTAKAGLDDIESSPPDALIVDFRLPDLDGLEFLRRLRADDRYSHIPVAIVTGAYFLDDQTPSALRELGADIRYKPLWLEDLADLARTLLNPIRSPAIHGQR